MLSTGFLKLPWSQIIILLLLAYIGISSALKGCKHKNRKQCSFNLEGLTKNVAILKMKNRIKQQILGQLGRPIRHDPTDLPPTDKKERKEGPTQAESNFTVTPTVIKSNISEFLIVSERPGDIEDKNIIKFQPYFVFQNHVNSTTSEQMVVKSANLLIRLKHRKRKATLDSRSQHSNSLRSRRMRRKVLSLTVSTVDENGKPGKEIATVKTKVGKSKWFRVTLPSSLIQDMIDQSQASLLLHVKCKRCRKYTEVILVRASRRERRHLSKSKKTKSKKSKSKPKRFRRKKQKMNKSRPILIVKVSRESKSRNRRSLRNRGQGRKNRGQGRSNRGQNNTDRRGRRRQRQSYTPVCSSTNGESELGCCREPFYFDFQEAGLSDWIIAPIGFNTSECVGSCHAQSGVTNSSNVSTDHSCRPFNPMPVHVLYFTESGNIGLSFLNDIVVNECSCQAGNVSTHDVMETRFSEN